MLATALVHTPSSQKSRTCHVIPHKDPLHHHVTVIGPSFGDFRLLLSHPLNHNALHQQHLPLARGYSFVTAAARQTLEYACVQKQISKIATTLGQIVRLLGGPSDLTLESAAIPRGTIRQTAFLSRPGLQDAKQDAGMTDTFVEMHLEYSGNLASRQYLKAHMSSSKASIVQQLQSTTLDYIDINTGICLFDKSVLRLSPGQGTSTQNTVIPPLPENVPPTMYELEIITRISAAIADTIALTQRRCLPSDTLIQVNIDIPDFEYYWTACELGGRGLVSLDYVRRWISAIDLRREQLADIMTWMIRAAAIARGLDIDRITISLTPGTASLRDVVKEELSRATLLSDGYRAPTLANLLEALRCKGPEAAKWTWFLDNLEEKSKPRTVLELCRIMYVFKALRPVLSIAQKHLGSSIIVQVDDVPEWRIFSKAKDYLQRYAKSSGVDQASLPLLIALFPMQRLFVAQCGRSDLYNADTSGRICRRLDGREMSPLQIIGMAYGKYTVACLSLFCKLVGLAK